MSSSRRSAPAATRPASPADRSSITVTSKPSASRAATTCEPMKPAPPVTIARGATRENLYRRRRSASGKQLFDNSDGLVHSLEHPHALEFGRQIAARGDPAKDDRNVGVGGAQVLHGLFHLPCRRARGGSEHDEVRGLTVHDG